jgi:methyl-accepting chemotaxis protein
MSKKYNVSTVFSAIDKMTAPIRQMQASIRGFTTQINQANSATGKLGNAKLTRLQVQLKSIRGAIAQVTTGVVKLGANLGKLAVNKISSIAKYSAAALGGSAAAGIYHGIDKAGEKESALLSYESVYGSREKAKAEYDRMVNLGNKTPFETSELVSGNRRLKVANMPTDDKFFMGLANMGSVMEKSMEDMVLAIEDANTGSYERLKEAFGIKVSTKDGKANSLTYGGRDIKVNGVKDVIAFLRQLGEEKYKGAAEKQMQSLKGLKSNLVDAIDQESAAIVENSGAYDLAKDAIKTAIQLLHEYRPALTQGLKEAVDFIRANKDEIKNFVVEVFGEIKKAFMYLYEHREEILNIFKSIVSTIQQIVPTLAQGIATANNVSNARQEIVGDGKQTLGKRLFGGLFGDDKNSDAAKTISAKNSSNVQKTEQHIKFTADIPGKVEISSTNKPGFVSPLLDTGNNSRRAQKSGFQQFANSLPGR